MPPVTPQLVRLAVSGADERALASQFGPHLGSGGVFLPTREILDLDPGAPCRFEFVAQESQAVLFSGLGVVIRTVPGGRSEPQGLLLRYKRLLGPERAVLDRLLLMRDSVSGLGLPVLVSPSTARVNGPPARGILALEVGGTMARAAVLREGK